MARSLETIFISYYLDLLNLIVRYLARKTKPDFRMLGIKLTLQV